jgi:hypothetical protein
MANEAQEANPQELNIQDLAIMKSIIDLASERNAFKPNEMAAVGMVYNKLEIFLKSIEEQQKAAQEAGEAPAAAPATDEVVTDGA